MPIRNVQVARGIYIDAGIACRFHGFTIDKALQKGAITGLAYALAPRSIIHSWVEVQVQGRWVNLEGFILDDRYLGSLQRRFAGVKAFSGYGAATPNLQAPAVAWCGSDTYIQKEGINGDFGVFADPDTFMPDMAPTWAASSAGFTSIGFATQ